MIRAEPVNTYPRWRARRKVLVSTLGPTLLSLTENELSFLNSDLEADLRELSRVSKLENEMYSLLEISILHFFRRSFDQIKNLFPIINNLSACITRDVCRAATTSLRYLAKESTDNFTFLRESLDAAKSYLHPQQKNRLIFNALLILNEVGRFLPSDVFGITLSHYPEIWNAVSSDDIELRHIAVKVITIHLSHLPNNIQDTFAESIFIDCNTSLSGKSVDAYHGAVLVYQTLYKLFPATFTNAKTSQMIEKIISVASTQNSHLAISIFEFIQLLSSERPAAFKAEIASEIIIVLITQIMGGFGLPTLFYTLNDLIITFYEKKICNIPVASVIDMIEFLGTNQTYNNYSNDIFFILLTIFKLFPHSNVSINLFHNATPCINYIQAIRLRSTYLRDVKERLMDLFGHGINPKSSEDDQIVSIFMVKTFDKLLFELNEPLLEILRPLTFSKSAKVRLYMTQTLPLFSSSAAFDELNRMAVMDVDKNVRMSALKQIKPELLARNPDAVTQLLADPSFKIRRESISLIAKSATANSIYTIPFIVLYVSDFFATNLAYNNPSRSAKACSLLPNIAEYFTPFSPPSIPTLVWVCLSFLYHGSPIAEPGDVIELGEFPQVDIRRIIHRDFTSEGFTKGSPVPENEFNRSKVYKVENEKWIEKRDYYLFQTLGKISNHLMPYLIQVIPVFTLCFSERHSDKVYIAAIETLTKIVRSSESRFNLATVFPNLLPRLHELLARKNISKNVAIALLKLTGTIGTSKSVSLDQEHYEQAVELVFKMKNPSFFTMFVMKNLTEMLKEPSPSIFEAIIRILVKDTDNALPYLGVIIDGFLYAIGQNTENDLLFNQLELISISTQLHMSPFVKKMQPTLIDHFSNINCIRLATVLSYHLKTEFCECASSLYPLALHLMYSSIAGKPEFFKSIIRFIDYAILYQNENFELFIENIEILLEKKQLTDDSLIGFLMKSLSTLVQRRRLSIYTARLARLAFSLLEQKKMTEICQLLYNLCVFGHLSIDLIAQFCSIPHLDDLKQAAAKGSLLIDDLPFIKRISPGLASDHLNYVLLPMNSTTQNVFAKLSKPVYNSSRQWLEELCVLVVVNSPSIAIRACSQVIGQSQAFRQELFPIAFLSCWKSASSTDQQNFSSTVKMILDFENIDPQVIQLAELVDRAGFPLMIADNEIAQNCHSTALSLYYLQRHLRNGHADNDTIQQLLRLNSRMGRIDSARGLLSSASQNLDVIDMGKWSQELGEWEKALEIYEAQPTQNLNELLQCYAHLEQWDNICKLSDTFETMPKNEKISNAPWFAWAYYHAHDLEKMEYYLSLVPVNERRNRNYILFNTFYLIASKKYSEAEAYIEKGFEHLTDNMAVFNGSDANEASKRMVFAQHLIELGEALQMTKNSITETPEIWQNRLRNFTHESDAWMKLLEIRSLILSPADNNESYLKILSVLRKERRWKLIDVYCDRFFSNRWSPNVMLARLKIHWSRGNKSQAVSILRAVNGILFAKTFEEFKESFMKISPEEIKFIRYASGQRSIATAPPHEIWEHIKSVTKNLNHKFFARMVRIQANWQYRLYTSKTSPASTLIDISQLFEYSNGLVSDDYRTWAGWAYASSRALSHFSELRSKFAVNAVSGFLKATQLRPSESLEYLCQMFSIFFRYGEEIELPLAIRNDIVSLPPAIIHQIIPQIVVHISHDSQNVREVVQAIINSFGSNHFQAVFAPLNVLSLINNEKKASIARKIVEELGNKVPKTFADSKLFIDGLHRSAVSWIEQWLTALDTASRAQQANDRESVIKLVQDQYDHWQAPCCELDRQFISSFGQMFQRSRMLFEKYKLGDVTAIRAMWDSFRSIFAELDDRMKKTETIQLSKVSEELANKRGFDLAIPGTYNVDAPSPQLFMIEPTLQVLSTQQHPRCVYMVDNDGVRWKFLLKGNEDLRLDQRIMQFFNLINSLLMTNRNTLDLDVSILKYAIVPFAPNAGLITWVTGADTFQQLVVDYRTHREVRQSVELEISQQFVGPIFNSLSSLQRYEIFNMVASQTHANELREMLWLRSPDPPSWLQRNRNFTISTALMSMAGYAIGLGDRHPSNIMVQRHTGRVIHIDFGDSFEVANNRTVFAERVPFRMTRMIVNALDGGCVDGLFRKCCEELLWVLRENQSSVIAQLEVFVHEPIFYGREIRSNEKGQKGILERVACKLSGSDPAPFDNPNVELDVEDQVDTLIKIAADPKEYVRHYVGWCPFW
ncbi:PIKK family atypical protein kinase [Tritrichomonas foetus]|uniref:Serine/threonine-protein kinase TOR n=1 Tax=Tritrichomonas foetus TaxID=1144522 RepID=A0A1J4K5I0_9EUKA|nr:PIKK family atypical protein kinase [Tritrichomonas foetus]|eukprot:OHT06128.1 PIKK family atypical protein kinase [Tritrichomonas foetus]